MIKDFYHARGRVIISQTAVYALKAVLHLAESRPGELARVDDIAAALHVPRNYLSKILHTLAREGILTSLRGPGGGFRLRSDPARITLERVVSPFDEVVGKSTCMLGRVRCSDANPCAAHERYKGISAAVRALFRETTIQDLSRDAAGKERVLA